MTITTANALRSLLIASAILTNTRAQREIKFVPDNMNTILYGVAYYPEYMPYNRLDKDVDLMQRAGITVVRVGESTWSTWEPRDGDFQFEWMLRVLDRMQRAGIKVILGTPTYSIPTWLYEEHPEIVVTHNGKAPPLQSPFSPTYPSLLPPGEYGPRQNYDFLNPYFRQHAERIIREIVSRFKDHPAVIGYQIDNETFPTGIATEYAKKAFVERLKGKYKTPATINKLWGLAYWGQLVDKWEDLPDPDGIVNPGYKLEWENFQHDVVTEYLAWQAQIVNEYKRPDQFITHDFSGGVHTNIDQWAIAHNLDIVGVNSYFETQKRFSPYEMWLSGDLARSLKNTNYLVTETNAQAIGWDSRTQFPMYPGQLRLAVYTHLAAGANMVEHWHWSSIHYGQEAYWKGVLSHDLEPNRTYEEVSRVAGELKKLGSQLVNVKHENNVAILFSADSGNAVSYMPFSDKVDYMSVLRQMYDALCDLNVEPDFIPAGKPVPPQYKLVLIPPLYSASDSALQQVSDYVKSGGHVVMAFKSGFTNEYSTVRDTIAPGPLRAAAGIHYQEFTSLAEAEPLTPDSYKLAEQNSGSVWEEFLVPDTASIVESFSDPYWHFPAITRNQYGKGTLTYEGTVLGSALQCAVIRDALKRTGLYGPDQILLPAIRVRHGRNARGMLLHYYLNFSGDTESFNYPYKTGSDLLTAAPVASHGDVKLQPWDLAIIAEQ